VYQYNLISVDVYHLTVLYLVTDWLASIGIACFASSQTVHHRSTSAMGMQQQSVAVSSSHNTD
jgi:hypothetical protein